MFIAYTFHIQTYSQVTLNSVNNTNWSLASTWRSSTLLGSITLNFNSKFVTSSGASFLTELNDLDNILKSATNTYIGTIAVGGRTAPTLTLQANAIGFPYVGNYKVQRVPTASDNVVVGNIVPVNTNAVCNDLTITNTLNFDATVRTLTVGGNLSGAGTINMSGGGQAHILNLAGGTNAIGSFTCGSGTVNYNYQRWQQFVFQLPSDARVLGCRFQWWQPTYDYLSYSGWVSKSVMLMMLLIDVVVVVVVDCSLIYLHLFSLSFSYFFFFHSLTP